MPLSRRYNILLFNVCVRMAHEPLFTRTEQFIEYKVIVICIFDLMTNIYATLVCSNFVKLS